MKKLTNIFIIIVLTSFIACEQTVTFTEPQPVGTEKFSQIPNRIQGTYLSLADSSSLIVNDNLILRIYDFVYKSHVNHLDSSTRISGDTLIDIKTNERALFKREVDSLLIHIHEIDTLFQLDENHVLKSLKGFYFLNTKHNNESWEVKKIQFTKGQLTISSISTKLELENLKEISDSPLDTVPTYNFTATKKQFKEFIKKDGFTDSEIFVRQKQ